MTTETARITDSPDFAEAWDAPQKAALEQGEIDRLTDDIIAALSNCPNHSIAAPRPMASRIGGVPASNRCGGFA